MHEEPFDGGDRDDALDAHLRVFALRARRRIVRALAATNDRVTFGELATRLSAATDGGAVARPVDRAHDGDRLAAELHHVHLPMLVEADVVDWDREAATVGLVDGVTELTVDVLSRGPSPEGVATGGDD